MTRRNQTAALRPDVRLRRRQKARIHRPLMEILEDRTMLDTGGMPAAIVIGRTLATPSTAETDTPSPSYFVGEVENNQVTITITVYNEQADPETGVLVTDTLAPGVALASASQPPDQSGQDLAWSLGTIQGYDRASVSMTVNLPNASTLPLDTGASAYAMLDAGAVSASTPAATLQPGNVSDPSLLAATVDADTNDPFIQEEAAELDYNAQNIFDFLHTQIVYNSYTGSVRGARGTFWSLAGNSLDTASLGVDLMRDSGIPAQYAAGTLSQSQAQTLILSMFPAQNQTVGYIPSGTQTSDPANDPQLLSETESHYWFQFDTGSGMTDADPLMPGATIGQTFTKSTGTFTAVPQALEETTEVRLVAEITNTATELFGLGGQADTTVLDQTFDDVKLVGRPVTLGFDVTSQTLSFIISSTTNTYSPYLSVGDDAYDATHDQLFPGQEFQETLTDFPFGSSVLTGVFLDVTAAGPQGPSQTYSRALFDRIGFAARQGMQDSSVAVPPGTSPAFSSQDAFTLDISAAAPDPHPAAEAGQQLQADAAQLAAAAQQPPDVAAAGVSVARTFDFEMTRLLGNNFLSLSSFDTASLAATSDVAAYYARPRIVLASTRLADGSGSTPGSLTTAIDILNDSLRVEAAPGQATIAAFTFNIVRGMYENLDEGDTVADLSPGGQAAPSTDTYDVFDAATAQGIGLVAITGDDLAAVQSLDVPTDAKARITADVQAGYSVIVPAQSVLIDGTPTIAWADINPSTGEFIGVDAQGGHQGLLELSAGVGTALKLAANTLKFFSPVAGFDVGAVLSVAYELDKFTEKESVAKAQLADGARTAIRDYQNVIKALGFLGKLLGGSGGPQAQNLFKQSLITTIKELTGVTIGKDPPVEGMLDSLAPQASLGGYSSSALMGAPASAPTGAVTGSSRTAALSITRQIAASWSSEVTNAFSASSLDAAGATVIDPDGSKIGNGEASLSSTDLIAAGIAGNAQYQVSGSGSLSFEGPAESTLGIAGDWQNYTASVTGDVSITLTVPAGVLTLNGQALPAGTYTITTSSATLSGSGTTSSPTFSGSASITATDGTINLGPGSGTLSVGGKRLDPTDETTLDGYSGTITVSANGDGTDSVSLNGNAGNVLQVTTTKSTFTTDQNTPITFAANVLTSLADTYNLTANAPPGWGVTIDSSGNVTATPAAGLQSGTYPIQIIAQSQTDSNLEAQTTVEVTITPTQPGMNFTVAADPQFTVPYNGAQLPTAFRASIQNVGPAADTYNLTFSNVSSGFSIEDSGTSVTVPAGATGILGIYLVPDPGQPIPPPGTVVSFTVTATSTTDSAITQTQAETFTVPDIDAVTVTAGPAAVSAIPGGLVTDIVTITNVGNVAEDNIALTDTLPSGLTLTGLAPVSLAVGQSTTETITLTPDASTPLNTTLDATITATFGPSASPVTQTVQVPVSVVVPGAAAIANAATAASQLGDTNLADQLGDLSTALTNLVQTPTSQVYMSQSTASLDAVINLLTTDPYLGTFTATLTADGAALAQAMTASAVQAALAQLGTDLGTVGTTLTDEAAYGFNLTLLSNSQVGQPQVATTYGIVVQNTGTQTTTYDLSLSGVPSGVTAALSQTSVTLAPGQATSVIGAAMNLSVTLTSNSTTELDAFAFAVQATAEGATEIKRTATGSFTARSAVIQVVSVSPNPAFTNPGGQVDVSTQILNAVNRQQQAEVSFTVTGPAGNVAFTSQPVPVTLNVLTTLTPVDLGNLDTTNFADGEYTIDVTVTNSLGSAIPGATGHGSLLIGSPVTATLASSPPMLPAGSGTVTNTLTISSSLAAGGQFTLEGQAAISGGASSVALYGLYAYMGGSKGIDVVDVSNPASPSVVKTFGAGDFTSGSSPVFVRVSGGDLLVSSTTASNSNFLVYSLANPTSPQLLGKTSTGQPFAGSDGFTIQGNDAFVNNWYFTGSIFGGAIYSQHGDLISADFGDTASPGIVGSLYGLPSGGSHFIFRSVVGDSHTLLAASTTSTGAGPQGGVGEVLVVDSSDPAKPAITGELDLPGTVDSLDIASDGTHALVISSTGGLFFNSTSDYGFSGNLVLSTLDLSNPEDPTLIASQTIPIAASSLYTFTTQIAQFPSLVSLGNGLYVSSGGAGTGNQPELLLINDQDPSNPTATPFSVPGVVTDLSVSGDLLYAASSAGLLIYNIAAATSTSITAQVTVPTNNGASIDQNSFSIAPSSVATNSNHTETLEWDLDLPLGRGNQTITWQSDITGLQPGQSLTVDLGATVQFTDQGSPGTLALPAQYVTGEQIIGLKPPAQTVAPAAPASYDVTLLNPTNSQVTYHVSVEGVPASWVNLPTSVTVAANGSADVTLVLTSDSFAALADYGFTVSASGDNGAAAAVQGDLILQGQPVLPDPQSHGVVATLTPTRATAGQKTSAQYVVQLTNTGSADDTFSLAATGLPSGVSAAFGETAIDVPPGASNFRDVPLNLSIAPGTSPGSYPFTVTATSTTDPTVTSTTSGTLTVTAGGVQVTLNPGSGAPGSGFQATVTNTGTVADTYNLALGGPAALVASLGTNQVTLAPGASQVVPISTGAVNFAVMGNLNLMAMATSTSNPAIQGGASADLTIPATTGMTAEFSPATQTVSSPGTVTFLLMVQNTGNTEDSYSATIMTTSGPVTATLIGLDGSPTQSIPTFILPGLSTGAIELQVDLSALEQGTVTVLVQSLTNSAETASPIAMVMVPPPPSGPGIGTGTGTGTTPGTGSGSGGTPAVTAGPEITKLQRYGYHTMPTTVVLTFSEALEPSAAEDVHDYRVVSSDGHHVKVRRAVYDAADHSVTLHLAQRLSVHHPYYLTVVGTGSEGISNPQRELLDSQQAGQPGGNDHIKLTWRQLVLGHVSREFFTRYHIGPKAPESADPSRDARPKTHATGPVVPSAKPFTRTISFPGHRSGGSGPGTAPPGRFASASGDRSRGPDLPPISRRRPPWRSG